MTATPRIYFDVTFSSSLSANVGVTRTVRRLFAEMEALAPQHGFACVPVVFNAKGFRELPRELVGSAAETWQNRGPRQSTASARLRLRPRLQFAVPLWLQRLSWPLLCGWRFNRRSRDLHEIKPRLGDILFLSDASWTYPVWRAASVGAKAGAKVVTVVYDLIPLRHPEYSAPLNTMALRRWLRRQLPIADAVMCISRAVKEDLEHYARDNRIRLGVTRTFRLGCDHRPGSAEPASARQAIVDFVTGGPCFTVIGSIEMRKNHALLLLTFDRLWSRGVDVRLLVMGGCDPQNRQLLEHIQSHPQFGKRLLVIANGDDAEVAFAYRGSRALLLPSSAEGFGLPLVEARAHGCRVIASDLAVFEELADDGVSTFPLQHPEMLDALILNHLSSTTPPSTVTPFTWKDSARQCMTVCLELTTVPRHEPVCRKPDSLQA